MTKYTPYMILTRAYLERTRAYKDSEMATEQSDINYHYGEIEMLNLFIELLDYAREPRLGEEGDND